jgi:hypothetical protein
MLFFHTSHTLFNEVDSCFLKKQSFSRFMIIWMVINMLLLISGCGPSRRIATLQSRTTVTPQVVATAFAAELVGTLTRIDNCLRVNSRDDNTSFALVWPPDFMITSEGNNVKVISGVVTGKHQEIVLHIGEMVLLGGGGQDQINDQLKKTNSENCQGPYWIVGFQVIPLP